MSNAGIQVGDVVRLKSGGPQMTVKWVEAGDAYCEWFDGNKKTGEEFALTSLLK